MSDPIHINNIQPGDYVRLEQLPGCKLRVGEVDRFNESLILFWETGKEAGTHNIKEVAWFWATDRII
jgi:hypothetical protein